MGVKKRRKLAIATVGGKRGQKDRGGRGHGGGMQQESFSLEEKRRKNMQKNTDAKKARRR